MKKTSISKSGATSLKRGLLPLTLAVAFGAVTSSGVAIGLAKSTSQPKPAQNISWAYKRKPPQKRSTKASSLKQAPLCEGTVCYYYAGGAQDGIQASGASATFSQASPTVATGIGHSLTELSVQSADGRQIIEVGWIVDPNVNYDSKPHLFVFHWVDGVPRCYNGCGFVSTGTHMVAGQEILSQSVAAFKIAFANDRWTISYNGRSVGYFPASLWGGRFQSIELVQVFGEVAESSYDTPQTYMGNGVLGTNPRATLVTNYTLYGSSTPARFTYTYTIGNSNYYTVGKVTARGFRYGGPGALRTPSPYMKSR